MKALNKKEPRILLLGDLFFFVVSLWLALFLRTFTIPPKDLFMTHIVPFGMLFVVWVIVYYIAGLYEKHTVILKSKLPAVILNTQLINSGIAVAFFYLVPFFGITPKTILFIYLVISLIVQIIWRRYGYFALRRSEPNNAVLIGSGGEMKELLEEVNSNDIYNLNFVTSVDLNKVDNIGFWDEIVSRIYAEDVSIVAIDLANPKIEPVLPHLYNLIFSNVRFIDMHKIYEDIFDRVPLSLLQYSWFLENISSEPRAMYDALKRIMDIFISVVGIIVTLPFNIGAAIAIKLDDGGEIFSFQNRVGQNNKIIRIIKFRTMTVANDEAKWGSQENKITKVGKFLRESRIDEFPQFLNVLKGDVSIIGPRPEFPEPVRHYTEEISYYNIRHIIKPGLSGWAQIYGEHPHHGTDVNKTKNKLSYDLYYIKNRSFFLDTKIILRTLKTLLSRVGI